jgi:hypothetical protein
MPLQEKQNVLPACVRLGVIADVRRILKKLEMLENTQIGPNTEKIAAALRRIGATGIRSDSAACPLANVLTRAARGYARVFVGTSIVTIQFPLMRSTLLTMPPHVERFVARFNAGKYPYLERPGSQDSRTKRYAQADTEETARSAVSGPAGNHVMRNMYPLKIAIQSHKLKVLIHDMADTRDADEIAAFLKVRGMLGEPILPSTCPIATYVRTSLGLSRVWVSGRLISPVEVSGTSLRCKIDGVIIDIPHLPQVRDFIYRFDRGYYPELYHTHEVFRRTRRYVMAMVIVGVTQERVPDD